MERHKKNKNGKTRDANYTIDELLAIGLVFSILLCVSFFVPFNNTGKEIVVQPPIPVNVSIPEKLDIDFSAFDFIPTISIIDNQNITIEVQNTGSTTYNATITVFVYNLSNVTQLTQLATYIDSTRLLYPGNTEGQRYVFSPATTGSYFVKGSVKYGARVKEVWGSFFVRGFEQPPPPPPPPPGGNETNQTNQTNQTQLPGGGGTSSGGGGGGGGGGTPQLGTGNGTSTGGRGGTGTSTGTILIPATPPEQPPAVPPQLYSMAVDYPERITVYRNITSLLPIKVTDDGAGMISGLIMFVSTPTTFLTDVNPKSQQTLLHNQSMTFLVSLFTSEAPPGEYSLEFKIISGQLKKEGVVIIDVKEEPADLKQFIYLRILNYKLLSTEISSEISQVSARGYNTDVPRSFIVAADVGLLRAREYYDNENMVKAFAELLDVEQNLKSAVFTLGNTQIRVSAAQPAYWMLVFTLPVIFIIVIIHRRRKDRRPRLLREAKEE